MEFNALNFKKIIVIFGDIIILYGSLALTLLFRYGAANFESSLNPHLLPFSMIFSVWILIFYLFDLYSSKFLKHSFETTQNFFLSIILNIFFSIILFYIFEPIFNLTPKTNLLIFALIFAIFNYIWRLFLSKIFISKGLIKKILIIGESKNIPLLAEYIEKNPQIGYEINCAIKNLEKEKFDAIRKIIAQNNIEIIIIDNKTKKDSSAIKFIYNLLLLGIKIIDLSDFYESIFQKIPIEDIEESRLIEQITINRHFYNSIKRFIDIILSFILIIIFLPIIILIFVINKTTSSKPAICRQKRICKNDKPFILQKFRSMKECGKGPLWTKENDNRVTAFGKFIRYTHLDELPQLFNIFKGDISFIGPRPENSELVELYKQLPYYDIRHLIKPGLTGWAQINYKPSASIEEAKEKLQYDIYYIKNQSLFLDLLILIKTIRYIFISH